MLFLSNHEPPPLCPDKKSEGIRKEAILARGKLEPKYLTIQYPIPENKRILAYKAELEAKKKRAS
ncbi:hypothetical protein KQI30_15720 [Clostridium bornimense]|uniref:hypothetical protein n=1 Tax=Clostridium bornimense TaxID=1216932 RepID=UPI001C1154B1|nr:hypothetical protein [Clostridium bornimense]MBU5317699.1 hypothetical protein [Clostridium bornimense]